MADFQIRDLKNYSSYLYRSFIKSYFVSNYLNQPFWATSAIVSLHLLMCMQRSFSPNFYFSEALVSCKIDYHVGFGEKRVRYLLIHVSIYRRLYVKLEKMVVQGTSIVS